MFLNYCPAGIQPENNVISTSMRRHDVASTTSLFWRHLPAGWVPRCRNFDTTVGRSYTGPSMFPVCKSDPSRSGQNPWAAHNSATVQVNDPSPCPTSKYTPRDFASMTSLQIDLDFGAIMEESWPCIVWVYMSPRWRSPGQHNLDDGSAKGNTWRHFIKDKLCKYITSHTIVNKIDYTNWLNKLRVNVNSEPISVL